MAWKWENDPRNPDATPSPQIALVGIFYGDDWQLADWQLWHASMTAACGPVEAGYRFNREAQRIADSYTHVMPPGFLTDKTFLAWMDANGLRDATSGGGADRALAKGIGWLNEPELPDVPDVAKNAISLITLAAIAVAALLALHILTNAGILGKTKQ